MAVGSVRAKHPPGYPEVNQFQALPSCGLKVCAYAVPVERSLRGKQSRYPYLRKTLPTDPSKSNPLQDNCFDNNTGGLTLVCGTASVDHHARRRSSRNGGRPAAAVLGGAGLSAFGVQVFLRHRLVRDAAPLDDIVDQAVHGGGGRGRGHDGGGGRGGRGRASRSRGGVGRRVLRVRRVLGGGRRQRSGRHRRGHVHELRRQGRAVTAPRDLQGRLGRRRCGQRDHARRRKWRQRSVGTERTTIQWRYATTTNSTPGGQFHLPTPSFLKICFLTGAMRSSDENKVGLRNVTYGPERNFFCF